MQIHARLARNTHAAGRSKRTTHRVAVMQCVFQVGSLAASVVTLCFAGFIATLPPVIARRDTS
jgi:hypothetical protein